MTEQVTIYHFLPLTRYRGAVPLLADLLGRGITPVLDLEDSVQCVFDAERNQRLKEQARHGLRQLAPVLAARGVAPGQVLVRINHARTAHYTADLAAVGDCFAAGFFPEVLLPKVEQPEDLLRCQNSLPAAAGRLAQVTPLIESLQGVARLQEILSTKMAASPCAVFGYFDYAVDAGHWPIHSQFSAAFWKLSLQVRETMEQHGVRYIHSPYPHLTDEVGLLKIKSMLQATGSAAFGMCSLSSAQSTVIERPVPPGLMRFESEVFSGTAASFRARAEWVVQLFEFGRANKRSFAISEGYFISPHEYWLAKQFLERTPA
jgi:citrate lyase beta subunit